MIYKFRKWIWIPHVSEIFISANTDYEALCIMENIDLKTLSWEQCSMTPLRMTYEVVKDVKVKNISHRTVDRFREES